MADVPISGSPGGIDPRTGSTARAGGISGKGGKTSSANESDGVAFRALLEKLGQQAKALEQSSHAVDNPDNLAGAVEGARASLEDALSLGEELLESYRQSRHQSPEEPNDEGQR